MPPTLLAWFRAWIPFLFGTPQRTLVTVVVLMILFPGALAVIAGNLLLHLSPFVGAFVTIAIFVALGRWAITGRLGGKGGGK